MSDTDWNYTHLFKIAALQCFGRFVRANRFSDDVSSAPDQNIVGAVECCVTWTIDKASISGEKFLQSFDRRTEAYIPTRKSNDREIYV